MLTTFDFEDMPVRSLRIDGEPWVVGKDACRCLGIVNHNDALARLADDERKGVGISDPLGKNHQEAICINEPGLYRLIFSSTKPEAERFRRFVFHEVLPAIRRTGRYEADGIDWEATAAKLSLIKQARLTHGRKAAQALWAKLGLPEAREEEASEPAQESGLGAYLADFLDECTERGGSYIVQSSELFRLYGTWAAANKAPYFTLSMFGRMMKRAGIGKRQSNVIYYLGLRIRHDARAKLVGPS